MMAPQSKTSAQTLIHYWSFNNLFDTAMITPNIVGIHADFSIHDTSLAKILYAKLPGVSAAYSTYIDTVTPVASDSDIYNAQFSDTAGLALRVRNPSDSMGLLFYIPTIHYHNISLAFEMERTTSGAAVETYDYSIDSGVTFTTAGLSMTYDSIPVTHIFRLINVSFSDAVANSSKLVFRIQYSNGSNGTSGNHRYDNVTVMGDSITGPLNVTMNQPLGEPVYTLHPNPTSDNVIIDAAADGEKMVTIINEMGQTVYTATATGLHFAVNTSSLSQGSYYISVRENATGSAGTLKFIKQ